ncbi:uncharacterized protein C4orf54 homolog [Sceloporus undulatus]|uniref:uncharacterized protein C4orf54 homolog n=1 Tax=Sceloporus undulatus TaxID=8520 RepID=UPI001C4B8C3A|nr:uncharacterized protein C4orf54 homolog [Sceloporus undulatus]
MSGEAELQMLLVLLLLLPMAFRLTALRARPTTVLHSCGIRDWQKQQQLPPISAETTAASRSTATPGPSGVSPGSTTQLQGSACKVIGMEVLTKSPAEQIIIQKGNAGESSSRRMKHLSQQPSTSSSKESKYVEIYDFPGGRGESPQTVKLTLAGNGSKVAFIRPKNGSCGISEVNRLANNMLADKSENQESQDYKSKMEGSPSPMGMKADENHLHPLVLHQSKIQGAFQKWMMWEQGGKTSSSSFGYDSDEDDDAECKEICLSNQRGECRRASQLLQSQHSYSSENNSNNDEAHYITTHEIQLSEVDHDMDFDYGLASRWDFEDNNVIYSFVDYASFGSEETLADTQTEEDNSCYLSTTTSDPNNQTDSIDNTSSTEIVSINSENDTPITDKCTSSEESQSKNLSNMSENSAGQILLSIKPTSRAINEPSNQPKKQNIIYAAKHEGDMSVCVSTAHEQNSSLKQDVFHDYAKKFIAVPARLQTKCGAIRGRELGGYSSGASSVVSELDDADKEVRSLTARAFRSLAYPYFDTLNLSSRESSTSLSDHNLGINRWSTYLDLKCGSLGQKAEQNLFKSNTTSAGWNRSTGTKTSTDQFYIHSNKSQTKALEFVVSKLDGEITHVETPPCFEKRIQSGSRVVTLLETLNFSSNINAGVHRLAKPSENTTVGSSCTDEVTDTLSKELGNEACKQSESAAETMDGTQKKSKFASSLLKNVISKKMQLEHEFKMERGEITDTTYSGMSNSLSSKEVDGNSKEKLRDTGLQRQNSRYSEGSSDYTIVTGDDLGEFFDSKSPTSKASTPREGNISLDRSFSETFLEEACKIKESASETLKATFLRSQNSAFRTWKEKEAEKKEEKTPVGKLKISSKGDWKADLGEISASKSTKMSRLFVPNIQQTSKEKQSSTQVTKYSTATSATAQTAIATTMVKHKPPEIKISLGSVQQNKDNPFNIAKLLTPKITGSVPNFLKTVDDTRCQQQKQFKGETMDKVPQFQVRDVRENKAKVQGPIHQVRDVRKLIKSNYGHESGDNSDRGSVNSDQGTSEQKPKQLVTAGIPRSLSPMVITCQAVSNIKEDKKVSKTSDMEAKASSGGKMLSSNQEGTILVHRTSGRLPVATIAPNKSDPHQPAVLKIVSKTSVPWRQQAQPAPQPQPSTPEKSSKVGPLMATGEEETSRDEAAKASVTVNHQALEKLTAAVRSMEELYSFHKNEWKRKSDPLPITDSHVLSLIASEERNMGAMPCAREESMAGAKADDQMTGQTTSPSSITNSRSAPERQPNSRATNPTKNAEKVSAKMAAFENMALSQERPRGPGFRRETMTTATTAAQERGRAPVVPRSTFTFNAQGQKAKQKQPKESSPSPPPRGLKGQGRPRSIKLFGDRQGSLVEAEKGSKLAAPDCGNYLAIPLKASSVEQTGTAPSGDGGSHSGIVSATSAAAALCSQQSYNSGRNQVSSNQAKVQQQPEESTSGLATGNHQAPSLQQQQQPLPQATAAAPQLEVPPAQFFPQALSLAAAAAALTGAAQPAPLLCFSPPMPTASAETSTFSPPQTQRKVLLDLSTGQCYVVDTPVQPPPPQKRRLFDPETGQYVEVPLPVTQPPPAPAAMAPMTLPMTLGPAAAAGTYGTPAAAYMIYPGFLPAVLPASTLQGQLVQHSSGDLSAIASSSPGADSPYYMPTGKGTQQQQQQHHQQQTAQGEGKAPLISITSQPLGPRIIAPPSFDGTTMRFVVEHR